MITITESQILRMSEILKTIAHPVRLDILKILHHYKNMTVSDIQKNLDCNCEQATLSNHLIKMKDKGLLKSVKEGKNIIYSIVDENICKIFKCMQECKL
ncbi:MAG: helix-turn-helix transcriptional regulator [Flavobacteriales bacterium]|nr:helix-turn-helix transcriptional regulator [Flavobacteriales bacterium]